jgi:hypothetical protein
MRKDRKEEMMKDGDKTEEMVGWFVPSSSVVMMRPYGSYKKHAKRN